MDKILKDLEVTFDLISTIPVCGNAVDAMAEARVRLRRAFAGLKEEMSAVPEEGAEGK